MPSPNFAGNIGRWLGGFLGQTELRAARIREGFRRIREAIPRLSQLDSELGQRLQARVGPLGDLEERLSGRDGSSADSVRKALAEGEALVGEALAFVTAAAASWLGLGGQTISLAQAWLDRLSRDAGLPPVGLVVPASTEYTGMEDQVIRLLMPDDGIWGLVIAIHEYGHFAGSVLARRESEGGIPHDAKPVEKLLYETAVAEERPKPYWHGHELFADAFAAAVVGPAYTRYCIEYRFDPALAYDESDTHPCLVQRVSVQLQVLEALGRRPEEWGGYLAAEAADIRRTWEATLATQEAGVIPANPARDSVRERLVDIVLSDPRIRQIHYRGHTIAAELSEKLPQSCPPSVTPAVIINAAWIARMKLADPDPGDDRATAALKDLAARTELLIREACTSG